MEEAERGEGRRGMNRRTKKTERARYSSNEDGAVFERDWENAADAKKEYETEDFQNLSKT